MGYIHSWDLNKQVTEHEMTMIGTAVKKLIDFADAKICGPYGTGEPYITKEEISFNGSIKDFNDHDTFSIISNIDNEYKACKTDKKPYDELVVATLILLKYYKGNDIHIETFGTKSDWMKGTNLAKHVLPEKEVDKILEEIEFEKIN